MKALIYTAMIGLLAPLALGQQKDVLDANAEQDTLDIAKQLYFQAGNVDAVAKKKLLERAVDLLQHIDKKNATSEQYAEAIYMQAVCLSELGEESRSGSLLCTLMAGDYEEYSASAAYRLGSLRSAKGAWADAEAAYKAAHDKTSRKDLRHDAYYRMAQAQMRQEKYEEAEKSFSALRAGQDVPASIQKAAIFSLANLKINQAHSKNKETNIACNTAALAYYCDLMGRDDLDDAQRGTATLQAARLASRLGRSDEAATYYTRLVKLPGMMEKYAGEAQMESIYALYKQGKYREVTEIASQNLPDLKDKKKTARLALIVGQSYMECKDYQSAGEWFTLAMDSCPDSPAAADASYRRILCVQQRSKLGADQELINMIELHLKTFSGHASTKSLTCNDLVRLIYADRLLASASSKKQGNEKKREENLRRAYQLYREISFEKLPKSVRPEAEYKRAWCACQLSSKGKSSRGVEETKTVIKHLDDFIRDYPDSSRLPEAYALRGSAFLQQQDYAQALKDFDKVINDYPDSSAAPVCMQKAAQAASEEAVKEKNGDKSRMVKYYESLIRCESGRVKLSALAEAHYNIARYQYESDPIAAVEHFKKSKQLDPQHYGNHADMSIVQCYFKKQDAQNLLEALQAMESRSPELYAKQPPVILRWCGWTCFQAKDYTLADKYLGDSVAFEKNTETYKDADGVTKERPVAEPLVWKSLARARLEIGKYEEGLEAVDHYLSKENQPYRTAEGMRDKALLLVGLKQTDKARELCEAAIEMGVDGPLKSSLLLAMGDAWYADGQYAEAAKWYARTAGFIKDKDLKPQALYKIAFTLRKIGKVREAAPYEEMLKTEFPKWTPSVNIKNLMTPDAK